MAEQEVNIRINTDADSGKVKDYAQEYARLRAELDETKEKLAELTEQAEENPMLGHQIPELTEEVEALEDALKKASSQMAKNAGAAKKTGTALKKAGDEGTGLRDALAKARVEMGLADVAAARLKVELRELAEAEEKAAEEADENSKSIAKIATIEKAESVGRVADQFGQVATRVRAAGKEISAFNPELGEMIEGMGYAGEVATDLTSSMAAGFAAGGPLGGAIAGVGVAIGKVYENWIEAQKIIAEGEANMRKELAKSADMIEDYGELLADRKFEGYADGLQGEIDLLDRLNGRVLKNIELNRNRAKQDRENAQADRDFAKDESDRAFKSGQISETDNIGTKGRLNLEEAADSELAQVKQVAEEVESINQELAALASRTAKRNELILDVQGDLDVAQANLDSATEFQSTSELKNIASSLDKQIASRGRKMLAERAKEERNVANLRKKIESLKDDQVPDDQKTSALIAQLEDDLQPRLNQAVELAGEDFQNAARKIVADVSANQQEAFTKAEESIESGVKDILQAAEESGKEVSASLKGIPEQIKKIYTDSTADSEQGNEIRQLLSELSDLNANQTAALQQEAARANQESEKLDEQQRALFEQIIEQFSNQAEEMSQNATRVVEESNKVSIKQAGYHNAVVENLQKQATQIADQTRQLQQIQSQISR